MFDALCIDLDEAGAVGRDGVQDRWSVWMEFHFLFGKYATLTVYSRAVRSI
jgi:hypothetical protein